MTKVLDKIDEEALPVYHVQFSSQPQNFPPKFEGLTRFGAKFKLPTAEISSDVIQQLSSVFITVLKSSGGPEIECSYKKYFDLVSLP